MFAHWRHTIQQPDSTKRNRSAPKKSRLQTRFLEICYLFCNGGMARDAHIHKQTNTSALAKNRDSINERTADDLILDEDRNRNAETEGIREMKLSGLFMKKHFETNMNHQCEGNRHVSNVHKEYQFQSVPEFLSPPSLRRLIKRITTVYRPRHLCRTSHRTNLMYRIIPLALVFVKSSFPFAVAPRSQSMSLSSLSSPIHTGDYLPSSDS